MTAFVLTRDTRIDELTVAGGYAARAGGDTIDTNGFGFSIDCDTRYGLGATASTSLGSMTINATKGGSISIDARFVRMIPFTGGSGTLAKNAAVIIGGAECRTLGLYANMTSTPVWTGVATGWLKVTNAWANNLPSTGTYTVAGFTFTISGSPIVGFIEVVGDEASTINANRLGQVSMFGEWFELGMTSGVSNQTLQIPNNGTARYCPGVYIESSPGDGFFQFYPNNGTNTTTGQDATRGKVCWIDATGLVRLGNSGAATNGYTPVANCRVVVGNIFLENCTTAARTANVIPNATIATRYDFTTSGGGNLSISKVSSAWYLSVSQAYSLAVTDSAFIDSILLAEIATPCTLHNVGVGNKPTTALLTSPLNISLCFAGVTLSSCRFHRVSLAASGAYIAVISDSENLTVQSCVFSAGVARGNASTYSIYATRLNKSNFDSTTIIEGAMFFTTCAEITIFATVYCETVSGTTVTTYTGSVWAVNAACTDFWIEGLELPVTNNQPYTCLLQINAAGCRRIKMRSITVDMGTVNACGLIYALAAGAAASDVQVARVTTTGARTGIMSGDNSSKNITEIDIYGDYGDTGVTPCLNHIRRGIAGALSYTAQTAVYGTHWIDNFIDASQGRIGLLMNEPNTQTQDLISLSGTAAFTAAGGLYMPTTGDQATFESPRNFMGHDGFQNLAAVMAGGTIGNYRFGFNWKEGNGPWQRPPRTLTPLTNAPDWYNGIVANEAGTTIFVSATTSASLLVSTNSGTTWLDKTTAINNEYLTGMAMSDSGNYGMCCESVNGNIWISTNSGVSWSAAAASDPLLFWSSIYCDSTGLIALAVAGAEVYKTTDQWATKTLLDTSALSGDIQSVAIYNATTYAVLTYIPGISSFRVHVTPDGGTSWSSRDGTDMKSLNFSTSGTMLVLDGQDLIRSSISDSLTTFDVLPLPFYAMRMGISKGGSYWAFWTNDYRLVTVFANDIDFFYFAWTNYSGANDLWMAPCSGGSQIYLACNDGGVIVKSVLDDASWVSGGTPHPFTAAQLGTALNGIVPADFSLGIGLRLWLQTTTANTTAITSLYLKTNASSPSSYQNPIDFDILTITGFPDGSDVVVYDSAGVVVAQVDAVNSPYSVEHSLAGTYISVGVFNPGWVPYMLTNIYPEPGIPLTIPVQLSQDRNYA